MMSFDCKTRAGIKVLKMPKWRKGTTTHPSGPVPGRPRGAPGRPRGRLERRFGRLERVSESESIKNVIFEKVIIYRGKVYISGGQVDDFKHFIYVLFVFCRFRFFRVFNRLSVFKVILWRSRASWSLSGAISERNPLSLVTC